MLKNQQKKFLIVRDVTDLRIDKLPKCNEIIRRENRYYAVFGSITIETDPDVSRLCLLCELWTTELGEVICNGCRIDTITIEHKNREESAA